jgi:hypothetical protein
MTAVATWAATALILAGVAAARGLAHPLPLLPDWKALGSTPAAAGNNLLAVIPIVATVRLHCSD